MAVCPRQLQASAWSFDQPCEVASYLQVATVLEAPGRKPTRIARPCWHDVQLRNEPYGGPSATVGHALYAVLSDELRRGTKWKKPAR